MLNDLTPEQRRLATVMSDLATEAYCAGWMRGLEHALWRAVVEGPRSYGRLDIGDGHIRELRDLATGCGGWIVFDDAREETWLPTDEWERRYDPAQAGS